MMMVPPSRSSAATFGIACRRCASSRCIQTAVSITRSKVSPRACSAARSGRLSLSQSIRGDGRSAMAAGASHRSGSTATTECPRPHHAASRPPHRYRPRGPAPLGSTQHRRCASAGHALQRLNGSAPDSFRSPMASQTSLEGLASRHSRRNVTKRLASSFRMVRQQQTRNLEIPVRCFARPGMTASADLREACSPPSSRQRAAIRRAIYCSSASAPTAIACVATKAFTEQVRRHRSGEQQRDARERPRRIACDHDHHQRLRHRLTRAEPADQRGVGDQEQARLAQQRLGQVEQRREARRRRRSAARLRRR